MTEPSCESCARKSCSDLIFATCMDSNYGKYIPKNPKIAEWQTIYICSNCGEQSKVPMKQCTHCHAVMRNSY